MNTYNRDTFSLLALLDGEVDLDINKKVPVSALIVPKIQRPYAQGRSDEHSTFVRQTFLNELFDSLEAHKECDLNFVYGIVNAKGEDYILELLDGQQRVTTLFLLYWYISCAELRDKPEKYEIVKRLLQKFKYETRTTATLFCYRIVDFLFRYEEGIMPSECIRKVKWYFKSFDRDSTVCAMLNTLDDIHNRYTKRNSKAPLFDSLEFIRFYVKSLGVFNLSEELYIKMNARGLQLSAYENFKADMINFINQSDFEGFRKKVKLFKGAMGEEVNFDFNFFIKLDSKWIDIFWKKGSDEFDDSMMSFFSRFLSCRYVVDTEGKVSDKEMRSDKTIEFLYTNAEKNLGKEKYMGFKVFEEVLSDHPENLILIDKVLDTLYDYDHKANAIFSRMLPSWERNETNNGDDFYKNYKTKNTHVKMIALSAFISFIVHFKKFDVSLFDKWMRVAWNVIENTNIDSLQPMASLMRKFDNIARWVGKYIDENNAGFFEALSTFKRADSSEKENRAVLEEVEKARRIADNSDWEEAFKKAENHPYFKGMVSFFYSPDMNVNDFRKAYQNASLMFDENGITDLFRKDHILIRAIVSQLSTWELLNNQYITERAETQKYLKNLLASNEDVQSVVTKTAICPDKESMIRYLQQAIESAPNPQALANATDNNKWGFYHAVDTLRNNVTIYNWMAENEAANKKTFRVYTYKEHIMLAQPRTSYSKIALDTERAKTGALMVKEFGFDYHDPNQKGIYDKTGEVFGNDFWLRKDAGSLKLWIGFIGKHELKLQITANSVEEASKLVEKFENAKIHEEDSCSIQFPVLQHWDNESTYDKLTLYLRFIFKSLNIDDLGEV